MKINYYIGLTLLLGACAAPTASIELESELLSPKESFLFYVDENTSLHRSELLTTIQLPSKDYLVPSILNLLPKVPSPKLLICFPIVLLFISYDFRCKEL